MALVRCITAMGMGVDVHGLDYTLAAKRAVFDAIHHSSLGFARLVGATADDMIVHVTIRSALNGSARSGANRNSSGLPMPLSRQRCSGGPRHRPGVRRVTIERALQAQAIA
jgi:hypothetical protein